MYHSLQKHFVKELKTRHKVYHEHHEINCISFFSFVHTQTTDIDLLEALIPLAVVIFLVFIFDFYIESFCLAKLESPRTGKIGSIASFLSAMVIALLWDKPWAWSMHEWHHGKPSDPHLVSAGTFFSAFFFVLGRYCCSFFLFLLLTRKHCVIKS